MAVTLNVPITLSGASTLIEVELSTGYTLTLVGAAVVAAALIVDFPVQGASLTLPIFVSGSAEPNAEVRIINDGTGTLLKTLTADTLGAWSGTLNAV